MLPRMETRSSMIGDVSDGARQTKDRWEGDSGVDDMAGVWCFWLFFGAKVLERGSDGEAVGSWGRWLAEVLLCSVHEYACDRFAEG